MSTTRPPRRRSGVLLIGVAVLSAASALGTWLAPAATAIEFASFDLRANANGYTFFNDDASGARQGEGTVPHTEANLQNGPVGSGLATVFWPGPLAANAGTLILVLQPTAPEQAKLLNYPVRAAARSGDNPPTNTFDAPGTTLTATAEAQKVSADAVVANSIAATGAAGTTQSHSVVQQDDKGGTAESSAKIQDFVIGPIKIEQVVSTAKATTDGVKADGVTSTVVSGMTVGGQPAYVDEKGLHIGDQNQPVNAVANQIAQQALSQGGFNVFVSTPSKEVDGSSANVTAGSLIITQKSDSGVTGFILGGAHAQVAAAAGDPSLLAGGDLTDTAGLGGGTGDLGDLGGTGSLGDVGTSGGGTGTGTGTGGSGTGGQQVALGGAKNASSTGDPIKPAPVIFGLLAAFALAAGMRRLSDDVLAEQVAATTCSLEGDG